MAISVLEYSRGAPCRTAAPTYAISRAARVRHKIGIDLRPNNACGGNLSNAGAGSYGIFGLLPQQTGSWHQLDPEPRDAGPFLSDRHECHSCCNNRHRSARLARRQHGGDLTGPSLPGVGEQTSPNWRNGGPDRRLCARRAGNRAWRRNCDASAPLRMAFRRDSGRGVDCRQPLACAFPAPPRRTGARPSFAPRCRHAACPRRRRHKARLHRMFARGKWRIAKMAEACPRREKRGPRTH